MTSKELYALAKEAGDQEEFSANRWLNKKAALLRKEEAELARIRVWCIGSDGTEMFAAYSKAEVRKYYRSLGTPECEDELKNYFSELSDIDRRFRFKDGNGKTVVTTWREIAAECDLPAQVGTSYN